MDLFVNCVFRPKPLPMLLGNEARSAGSSAESGKTQGKARASVGVESEFASVCTPSCGAAESWRSSMVEGDCVLCWFRLSRFDRQDPHGRWLHATVTSLDRQTSTVTVVSACEELRVLPCDSLDLQQVARGPWDMIEQATVFSEHLAPFERLGCDRIRWDHQLQQVSCF